MSLEKTCEFEKIVKDIVNHEEFIALKHELHHGISRFEHSMRVAKMTYQITKKAHLDYERATRAALLHDFFKTKHLIRSLVRTVFFAFVRRNRFRMHCRKK